MTLNLIHRKLLEPVIRKLLLVGQKKQAFATAVIRNYILDSFNE